MSNKKIFDDLHHFFLKVNKFRIDVMRQENPNDTYNYFANDEEPESVIRKGMVQYEDLLKRLKRLEKKGGIKLSKGTESQKEKPSANIKTTKPKKEENEKKEEKEKPSPKKRKLSGNKEEKEKEEPKKRKLSDNKEEGTKDIPKKRKLSGNKEEKKDSPKKRKLSDNKEEGTKDTPKKRKLSGNKEEENKEEPKKRKLSGNKGDENLGAPKKRKISGNKEEENVVPPKKRKISGNKEEIKQPYIVKRTVGTDNPIVKIKKENKNKAEEQEEENELNKENEENEENEEKEEQLTKDNFEFKMEERKEPKKEPQEEKENKKENDNFIQEPEEGYENSQIETADYEINPNIKLKAEWYYIDKKKSEEEDENDEDPEKEEKVHIRISAQSQNRIILHWGIYKAMYGLTWYKPPKESLPPNTKEIDNLAVETEFPLNGDRSIEIKMQRGKGYKDYIGGINFVIYDPGENVWYNNYRKDYQIKFKLKVDKTQSRQILIQRGLYVPDFMLDVINCEANYGSWTLMHRYNKCSDIIRNWDLSVDNDKWIWILIWLRYSFLRQLDWQRNYNTRPVLLSGAMAHLSDLLTGKYGDALKNENEYKNLINSKSSIIKNILSLLGKGTGNGQEIRDEILKVMSRNKIPKTHLGNFYEQWHQKLHNNSTPEDITICQAVINFLRAKGDMSVYWKTLKEGGISKERLASYERNITNEPWYSPNYNIADFENYLRILKSVHASTDLVMTYDGCKGIIGGGACNKMNEILRNKDTSDIIGQIRRVAELREELDGIIRREIGNNGKLREVLFLELSLEVYVRQLVEKVIHIKLDYKSYINEISLVLRNIKISYPKYKEFNLCYEDWKNIVEPAINDQSKNTSLKVKSVISRLNRLLTSVIDYYNNHYDAKGKYFGKECNCDNFAVEMFTEELIRGSIFFALSMLLKKIEPIIRQNAQLGEWLIISRGNNNIVNGKLIHVPKLHDVQFTKYTESTIIISENVSGDEEVPVNCKCLVIIKSENYPDVLAHVSVRARNLNVPFAVCFNEKISDEIMQLLGKNIEVKMKNQEFIFGISKGINKSKKNEEEKVEENKKVKVVDSGKEYKSIFVELEEFDKNCVGAKANNTKKILGKVPGCDWLKYPESFAIPFNVHEYFLSFKENKDIKEEIDEYIEKIKKGIKGDLIRNLLEKCKNLTKNIKFVENSETIKLKKRLLKFGVKENEFKEAFNAIKSVWASKFNERVYIATSKVGITLYDIKMSVLCQKIIPAEYAYVIHTKNPTNNDENEVFAEVVTGMGETLVGAYEGQSFSFSFNKKNKSYDIKSYPNKSISLRNSGFIFRSDSNTEDLEGFSGAGLFDSIPMVKDSEVDMVYHNNKLFNDKKFVDNIITKIGQLGIGVEKMYGIPQDIEGVYYNNDLYIVQTRPQV